MNEKEISALRDIAGRFGVQGTITGIQAWGGGHINETYRLDLADSLSGDGSYYLILQKINRSVFHRPDQVMANAVRISSHLREKIQAEGGDPERETLTFFTDGSGQPYYLDENGEYWRMEQYIAGARSYDHTSDPVLLEQCGEAFGRFHSRLSDFPAETLYETIPAFHDTSRRYQQFLLAVGEDPAGRTAQVTDEIEFLSGQTLPLTYEGAPIRVTHNDAKLDNVMFDVSGKKALCVVDLDTVMPGYVMNDFGDAIRSGASTAAEDEKDLSRVHFDLGLYEAFSRGFISTTSKILTQEELSLLPLGALLMTYEQALRFLTDYLNGDTYYKTDYPEHNLVRVRTQIRLIREMEDSWEEMLRINHDIQDSNA